MNKKRIAIFLLLVLPLISSSSLLAAKFPIEKKAEHSVSQMGVGAHVVLYANDKVDIKLGYSNGNRQIEKMYAAVFISFVDVNGNKLFAYERRQKVNAVSCFLFICGKTVGKSEATSVSLPPGIGRKVHDIRFTFITNYDRLAYMRSVGGLGMAMKEVLYLLSDANF